MAALADLDMYPSVVNTPHHKRWCVVIPIGAAGATGTLLQAPLPGLTVTNNGTGIYDVAGMPIAMAESTGKSRVHFQLYSPSLTVTECTVTADDYNAGTLTFKTSKAGTAAEPASGNTITMYFEGESE